MANKITIVSETVTPTPIARIREFYRHKKDGNMYMVINTKDGLRLHNIDSGGFWCNSSTFGQCGADSLIRFRGTFNVETE